MKNSPHRFKQLRKKAVRKFSQIDLKKESQKTSNIGLHLHNGLSEWTASLQPFDHDRAHEMILFFKEHQERSHFFQPGKHHSKRTTPGEVEGEGPYTFLKHHKRPTANRLKDKNLQKSSDLARRVLKYQNDSHRKAA